jgi:hypothetical protein
MSLGIVKVRFAICIASVAIHAFTKLLFSFSDVLKTTNCTFQEVGNIFCLAVGIAVYDEYSADISDRRATMILSAN